MAKNPSWPRVTLFGCPVDAVRFDAAVEWVETRIRKETPCRVGAVNAAKLVRMEREPELARAVTDSELILADGMSVVWAAHLLTGKRLQRVAGIDFMETLIARAAERGHRVYFLGAKPEVLERALEVLQRRHPTLQVAGSHHGYFSAAEEPRLVEAIRLSRPDIVFVGMGTPAKELWIDRHFRDVNAVCMGVGGSFDVVAGVVKRAPRWVQRAGLEWLYRLLQEPRRLWRRYLVTSSIFIAKVATQGFRRRILHKEGA